MYNHHGAAEGGIYGAMPAGMESTIKVRIGDYLFTGVVFGSTRLTIGAKVKMNISGDDILLFDRKSPTREQRKMENHRVPARRRAR